MQIKFFAPLNCVTFKRPMGGSHRYNDAAYTEFRNALGFFALKAMHGREPLKGAIKLYADVYKNLKPESLTFGDWDNHAKAICDALNGICYTDDRQIVEGHIRLFKGEPHIFIQLEEL